MDFSIPAGSEDQSFHRLHFHVFPLIAEELENATHQEEPPPERRTVLCIYGAVRGVGGIDSWGLTWKNSTGFLEIRILK